MKRVIVSRLLQTKKAMKKLNLQTIGLVLASIPSLFACAAPGGFPETIPPFGQKEVLMQNCSDDPICGSFRYEVYPDSDFPPDEAYEFGQVDVFKTNDVYYFHYQRDDGPEYIGMGILRDDHLPVTYIYPGFRDVGLTHYVVGPEGLLQGTWTYLGADGPPQGEEFVSRIVE